MSGDQQNNLFLKLPFHIRRSVYVLAGLVRKCDVDLNSEESHVPRSHARRYDFENYKTWYKCLHRNMRNFCRNGDCEQIPYGLFLASRQVSKEATRIFYSENSFCISASRAGGLSVLNQLHAGTISNLKMLSIRLNNCQCIPGHSCSWRWDECRDCSQHTTCNRGMDEPFSAVSGCGIKLVEEWDAVCTRLSRHVPPGSLSLTVICDCVDYDAAEQVLSPLSKLPLLRNCSIRVGQQRMDRLVALARETCKRLTGQVTSSLDGGTDPDQTVSFSTLPFEIREQILLSTDLVAPHDLLWDPAYRNWRLETCERHPPNYWCRLHIDLCCLHCSTAFDGCCCTVRHSAFSTACLSTCFSVPTELFCVSRAFRTHAKSIFWSRNRFRVWNSCFIPERPPLLSLTRFLITVVPSLQDRALIRHLICIAPRYIMESQVTEAAQSEWEAALEMLADARRQNPPSHRLTLEVDANFFSADPDATPDFDDYPYIYQPRLYQRVKAERQIVAPIKRIFGEAGMQLQDFFLYSHLEEELERSVMNDEAYDSSQRGKRMIHPVGR